MLTRRQLLTRALKGSSILALGNGTLVPRFLASTAMAAEAGKDNVLVIIEMTGGNDGLNMVIPYGDDQYYRVRPTIGIGKDKVIKVDDYIGLHPALNGFDPLLKNNELAIVQGVGYPNPNRSHFESMDVWQSGDPGRENKTGWVARSSTHLQAQRGGVPALQVGPEKLPLALRGADKAVASINNQAPLQFRWGAANPKDEEDRKKFLIQMVGQERPTKEDSLLDFVQRQQLQTYSRLDELQKLLENRGQDGRFPATPLGQKMQLVGQLIERGFGMRVFYLAIDGFDTHSGQLAAHTKLFGELSGAVGALFNALRPNGHDKRVMVLTYSEFGRRIAENGSGGTDHGAGSCLFVAGPGVKGGPANKHPSLTKTDQGDLIHHTDFRQVYATILDGWLGCESKAILGEKFEPLPFLKG
ncbi:MAG: DUF1501 domain-containing protein [Gemmataceae bacterium]